METNYGFEPVIDKNSEILILGSFPSVKSREVGFYYGNPQNRFWKTLESAYSDTVPKDTVGRKNYILSHKLALFDVYSESKIKGSADKDITNENSKLADLKDLIENYNLKKIICNGKTSYNAFMSAYKDCKIPVIYLSSTSSANPSFDKDKWITALKM